MADRLRVRLLTASTLTMFVALDLLAVGCTQEMANQKRLEPFEEIGNHVYPSSQRVAPLHTIPADARVYRPQAVNNQSGHPSPTEPIGLDRMKEMSGEPLRHVIERGRERFNIHCSPCHDYVGTGNGMVPRRGFPFPPSYHTVRLRAQPIEYFYHVATNGHGKMPAYGKLISSDDRWAIAAYVRTLQLSQYATDELLDEADRNELANSAAESAGLAGDHDASERLPHKPSVGAR